MEIREIPTGQLQRFVDPVQFQNQVKFLVLPESLVSVSRGEANPSVENITRLQFNNTGATTVLDLLHGQDGQSVIILGDGFTTMDHGLKIKTNTGVDKLLAANRTYQFTRFNSIWIEL